MIINLIRHSYTAGNLRSAYIGSTDEPLCSEGRELLSSISYPGCTLLFASPMKRCIETARLIYGDRQIIRVGDFRECDFGSFEGKSFVELKDDSGYQSWLQSGGDAPFPGGEDPWLFRKRCTDAFEEILKGIDDSEEISLVVHGGTIMSIMEKYARPRASFYDWHVRNGCGYICGMEKGFLAVTGYIG